MPRHGSRVPRAESDRIDTLTQLTDGDILAAEIAGAKQQWSDVQAISIRAMERLEDEKDAQLTLRRRKAYALTERAKGELARRAEMDAVQNRLRDFRKNRDEAQFLDSRFAGLTPKNALEATSRFSRAALGAFGRNSGEDEWTLSPLPGELADDEQAEVTSGFYELLLVLADAVAESHEREPAERGTHGLPSSIAHSSCAATESRVSQSPR